MSGYRAALAARLHEIRRLRSSPPGEQELARRRAYGEAMGRARVKVGRDFDVVQIIRELRDGADGTMGDAAAGEGVVTRGRERD